MAWVILWARVQAIMDELGVPAECTLVGSLIFGYAVKLDMKALKRDENVVLRWIS